MPKKVFISFDYTNDKDYRYLLKALAANSSSDIEFEDYTPSEIQSNSVSAVKAVLTSKIRESDYTLVIVGKHANSYHPDREDIGERNWQWWEVVQADANDHKFIAVLLDPSYKYPDPLNGKGATVARSFKVDSIVDAIRSA